MGVTLIFSPHKQYYGLLKTNKDAIHVPAYIDFAIKGVA